MPLIWIIAIIAALAIAGFFAGRHRAIASVQGDTRALHSLPAYYGYNVALFTAIPALTLVIIWAIAQPMVIQRQITPMIAPTVAAENLNESLVMSDVRRLAGGIDTAIAAENLTPADVTTISFDDLRSRVSASGVALGTGVQAGFLEPAQRYRSLQATGAMWLAIVALGAAVGGLAFSLSRTNARLWARNTVERAVIGLLILAASIAILTTVGIVMSLVIETSRFFDQYDWRAFFFGLTWSPNFHGNSQLGILPLLWGTLYISFIALLLAAPVGLMSAIYLSEYASPKIRATAKPLLEILAGIPTIVYGLFALMTVGPLLRDYFAQPLGLGDSSSSVMTAGLVMGIMLIPFVSSLSDDIINAVPQSMRDGSLAIGATQSETIRQVVIPAALPGIVGAILLAASRAIGETMIVVLGAGAAARLDLNPFEAMTTVTVKIVSQLTGDTDFSAPETLVAFALGLTLFVITLGLNVLALFIVRRYREQYE